MPATNSETLTTGEPPTDAAFADMLAEADTATTAAEQTPDSDQATDAVPTAEQIAAAMAFCVAPPAQPPLSPPTLEATVDADAALDSETEPCVLSAREIRQADTSAQPQPVQRETSAAARLAQGATSLEYEMVEGELGLTPAAAAKPVTATALPGAKSADGDATTPTSSPAPESGANRAPVDPQKPAEATFGKVADMLSKPASADIQGDKLPPLTTPAKADPKMEEKFAGMVAADRSPAASGGKALGDDQKNTSLSVDGKRLKDKGSLFGTPAANRDPAMPYSAATAARPTDATPSANGIMAAQTVANPAAATLQAATPPAAAHATQLVKEIRDIADTISSIERNSVEVGFNFGENDRLSVRVEYRQGVVHTTFRTDSPEVRDALAREWQAQIVTPDRQPYRVAEPVFNLSTSSSGGQHGSSSAGDGSSHQRASEQSGHPGSSTFSGSGRSASSTTHSSAALPSAARPSTSRHLHALA